MYKAVTFGHGGGTEGRYGHEHLYRYNGANRVWQFVACIGLAANGRCAADLAEQLPRGHRFDRRISESEAEATVGRAVLAWAQ